MINSGIAFIASHLSIDDRSPIEIFPGHTFRPARSTEILEIKKQLSLATRGMYTPWAPYDGVIHEERYEGNTQYHVKSISEETWKYWVIAFEGNNSDMHELELMGTLLPVEFDIALNFFYKDSGQSGRHIGISPIPLHIIEKYSSYDFAFKNAEKINREQLISIGKNLQLYRAIPDNFSFIKTAAINFLELRRIPNTSDLVVVGLFAIIESLITHAPRLSETLDSINHQITNKIVLLRKRFSRQILPEAYFQKAAEENIWKKLYSYRSAIAHGTPPDFSGSHQILNNRECVIKFLRDNIRELIQLALHQSEFFYDLRKC